MESHTVPARQAVPNTLNTAVFRSTSVAMPGMNLRAATPAASGNRHRRSSPASTTGGICMGPAADGSSGPSSRGTASGRVNSASTFVTTASSSANAVLPPARSVSEMPRESVAGAHSQAPSPRASPGAARRGGSSGTASATSGDSSRLAAAPHTAAGHDSSALAASPFLDSTPCRTSTLVLDCSCKSMALAFPSFHSLSRVFPGANLAKNR
mmetsp:Transcript_5871/g.16753  ORF Transcript_5871/g.16753 Transcript_5871/m.16753 type:complete len:211 (-) Transcript_5871:1319-1951(-)